MKQRLLICLLLFLSVQVYGQCTLSVSVTSSSPSICSGNSVTLTATASQGKPPYSYAWNTGETTPNINVNKGGTYTVTVTDKSSGCSPVKQSITVNAVTSPSPPTANTVTVCPNTPATLTVTNPIGTDQDYLWFTTATGGSSVGSGISYTTNPIPAATTFYVQVTIDGCTSTREPVNVLLPSRPAVVGDTVCLGNVATLMASGGDSYSWYYSSTSTPVIASGASYTTPTPLTVSHTYYVVVNLNGCSSARTPVTATVTPAPSVPTASNVTICSGSTAQLHASAAIGQFDWYSTPTGGTSLISSPDYTTPPLTANTTYYVETSLNGCSSARVPVTVTVDAPPTAPVAQTDSICYDSSTKLVASASPSGTYQWYNVPVSGTPIFAGNTYTTPVLTNSTTYYVQAVNGSCTTSRVQVNVIVKPQLAAPTTSGAIICYGSAATLTTANEGGTYAWYSTTTSTTPLITSNTYTTPALTTTTTYYVQRTLEGCISPRAAVKVTIEPADPAPTVAAVTICSGNTATLTAKSSDNIYAWYDAPSGGTLLSTSPVYVTPVLTTTTTYYVQTTSSNGCNSAITPVKVTVNPSPTDPVANGVTICPGTSASLTATTSGGNTIQWYNVNGSPVSTGSPYNTPILYSPTTYYVQSTNGTCTSGRVAVTVSMVSGTNPEFQYSSGTYCASGPNTTPVINNPSGGTFTSTPAGLVFVSNTTGEINVSGSTPGTYKVSFTNNAPCPSTTSVDISIVTSFTTSFSYASPFCQGGTDPLPVLSGGGTAGTFTATPAGLVFINSTTGQIDLANSTPGTYTVTNTISSTSCGASNSSTMVTIYPKVIVDAGPNQTVASGSTVQLAGSISGGATTGTWSGGTGTFSNPSDPNATYTPGPGETTAVLTLTSSDPPGPCGAQSKTVTITFRTQPSAPIAKGVTICSGNTASLAATAPGGTYQWFDVATNGTALYTGPVFTTMALTANTDYYVETTVNGVVSNRTKVTVTVIPPDSPPVIAGNTVICQGTATMLTASGPAGNYEWYDAPVNGNKISTTNSYLTQALNNNATYYVQAVSAQCTGARTEVDVTVNPMPNITSPATDVICSGNPLSYTITSDQPTAQFSWSRAKVTGISNPAVSGQTSSTITETLINTTVNAVNVIYDITPSIGSCTGPVFKYVVTVYPTPSVTSGTSTTVCDDSPINYTVKFNDPSVSSSWSRAAVAGISNAAVSGQSDVTIKEVLHNITNAPTVATYVFDYRTSACSGAPFSYSVTVNPLATITSNTTGTACSGIPESYAITSNIATATYLWSRAAVTGISNPAVTNKTSPTIAETLINTTSLPINVTYVITPTANGCTGTPLSYVVRVNPSVAKPIVHSNSPVCTGSTLSLATDDVIGATYEWTKPDGSTIVTPTPTLNIDNATTANSGIYTLIEIVRDCQSPPTSVTANVDDLAIANAGSDVTVCKFTPAVTLQGTVTGGSNTGIWSGGTGTFSPSSTDLTAVYTPSAAEIQQGFVTLTLTSTSKDGCPSSSSSMTITYGPAPGVDAGPDLSECSQDASIAVTGRLLTSGTVTWISLGTGTFSDPNTLSTNYMPSKADVAAGSVQLVLELNGNDQCFFKTDTMTIHFIPPATVNAGGTRYVLKGNTITLTPIVSSDSLTYLWSPNIDINNDTLKNPTITGDISRTYTVTVTDPRGCTSSDTVYVEVSPPINIDNTFTPNGDGINDTWNITGLIAYVNATVDIFNRYGQPVFHSKGYPIPWDGTYDGKPLPVGVYYYVIRLNFNNIVLSGPVTILR